MRIDYRKELNAEQYKVVMEAACPILVIAGAGSGKTRTLTYRVARLVESGTDPGSILLATFTNKAALSMLNRVRELVTKDLDDLWGGTFHHICHRILRANSSSAGLRPGFSILDSEDARQLMNKCIADVNGGGSQERFPRANVLLDLASLAGKRERPLEEIVLSCHPVFYDRLPEIHRVIETYERNKSLLNLVDFDDLLVKCLNLLRDVPSLAERYAARFRHILVDEYQDTDKIQAQIVDILAASHRSLMVVGDDSQSIYAFRGADYTNILAFPDRWPDCRIYKLETNYRSTPEILDLANRCIRNNERQFAKNLRPVRENGPRPVVVVARDVVQQANFVAQRLAELIRSGIPPGEMAVLYRAHFHSMELQMELTRRSIPFTIRSGIRFFEQAHVKDLVAFLRIMANPYDELAWLRILGMYEKVGPKTAERLWQYLKGQPSPLESSLTDEFLKRGGKAAAGLKRLQATLRSIANEAQGLEVPQLIEVIMEKGYGRLLTERYSDHSSRQEDLVQLAGFSSKFQNIYDFLSEMALWTNMEVEDDLDHEGRGFNRERVILSTIHQAKGLEWSVVFLIWCAEGMLPLGRALSEAGGEEEERRLFYVSTTRAKDQLYLAYPRLNYGRAAGFTSYGPSRFIRELSGPHFQREDRPYDQWVLYDDSY